MQADCCYMLAVLLIIGAALCDGATAGEGMAAVAL